MRRLFSLILVAALSALMLVGTGATGSSSSDEQEMRWDLVNINFTTSTVLAGGSVSARAQDGSKITLTGSGRFEADDFGSRATGGGTWTTYSPTGAVTGTGRYAVKRLVSFVPAVGTLPVTNDAIAPSTSARAGLLVVTVRYSTGETGVLTVSCHLVGTPNSVFEGITTTKGFVTYWNAEPPPAPPANGNRTLFHVLGDSDDDEDDDD